MKPRTVRYQTFTEIADETAKKRHDDSWRAFRDDYLEALIQDQWSGRFIDNAGQSCVFDLDPRKAAHAPARVTREIAWRMLGCYKPQSVREVREDSPKPWKIMTAAKIEEYGGTVVHDVFEIFALSEADARAWKKPYDKENLPRRKIVNPKDGHVGRWPASQSQTEKIWEMFNKLAQALTFTHGELTHIAREIGKATGYKQNSVEKLIRDKYLELKEKKKQNST